jgi:hypothetical protein
MLIQNLNILIIHSNTRAAFSWAVDENLVPIGVYLAPHADSKASLPPTKSKYSRDIPDVKAVHK